MNVSVVILTVVLAVVLAGCGSSAASHSGSSTTTYRYVPSHASVPSCAHPGKAIALPSGFPKQFPFPAGTNISSTKPLPAKNQIGIYGFVPSSSFAATVNFFKNQVPRQGFKRLDFEVDSPNDSEGTYQGFGKIGRWQLRSLPGCPRAMSFAASAEPSK